MAGPQKENDRERSRTLQCVTTPILNHTIYNIPVVVMTGSGRILIDSEGLPTFQRNPKRRPTPAGKKPSGMRGCWFSGVGGEVQVALIPSSLTTQCGHVGVCSCRTSPAGHQRENAAINMAGLY